MKKIKSVVFLSLFAFVLNSCVNEVSDNEISDNTKNQRASGQVTIKEGRMFFQSKEALTEVFQEFADADDDQLIEFLMPKYAEGFYSLRPIVTEKNEQFILEHYNKQVRNNDPTKGGQEPYDYLDELENIIGDDTFAAFLNSAGEIQIGQEIFKYTDAGLFFSSEDKYNLLLEYLKDKDISADMTIPTSEIAKQNISKEFPGNGVVKANDDISYFQMKPDVPAIPGDGSGHGIYIPHPNSPVSTDPSYNAFLSNLGSCDPHPGLFGHLFGDNHVCIDKYENRRRVKTKAFNYNYLVVYHLGVKCVHQYRGWTGFWRVEATDEIRLVVEAAQFEYDLDKLLGNTAINNNTQIKDFYLNSQKITYGPNNINVGGPFGFTYSNLIHTALPPVFQNEGEGLTFEWFGTGLPMLDNLIQGGINSNLNAKKLNDHFYNGLYDQSKSMLQNALSNSSYTPPPNRTFVAKFPENGKLIVQKAILNKGLNIGVRQKTFDWGAEIRFNASQNGNGSWSISGGQGSILTRPSGFRVKIIGAARRGSGWHGSKFAVNIDS